MSRKKFVLPSDLLGPNLRKLRKSLNLSMKKLADKIESSAGYISDVENGKAIPGGNFLYSLKRVFDVDLNTLFEEGTQGFFQADNQKDSAAHPPGKGSENESSKIQALQTQIAELKEDKADLRDRIKEINSERKLLIGRVSQLTEEFFKEKALLQERIEELKRELDSAEKGKNSA